MNRQGALIRSYTVNEVRVRVHYDETYSTSEAHAGDQDAIDRETEQLIDGEVDAVLFTFDTCCSSCGEWKEQDVSYGHVVPVDNFDRRFRHIISNELNWLTAQDLNDARTTVH